MPIVVHARNAGGPISSLGQGVVVVQGHFGDCRHGCDSIFVDGLRVAGLAPMHKPFSIPKAVDAHWTSRK
jgi:hypothetical protein